MSQSLVIPGRYADHTFTPDGPLPDVEGKAELIIVQNPPTPTSIFDLIGKATHQRSADEIAAQIEKEHGEWGDP
jgi:hypothetical protein